MKLSIVILALTFAQEVTNSDTASAVYDDNYEYDGALPLDGERGKKKKKTTAYVAPATAQPYEAYANESTDESSVQVSNQVSDQKPQISNQAPQVSNQQPQVNNQNVQYSNQQAQNSNQNVQYSNQSPQVSSQTAQVSNQRPQISSQRPQVQPHY